MTNISEAVLRDSSIVFVTPIDSKLKCFICNNLLVDAHIATCLHKFCRICIRDHLENSVNKKCIGIDPKCLRNELSMTNGSVLSRSFEINDQIEKLLVRCKISGCEEVIRLEDLENHLNTCDFRIVTCTYQNLGCTTQNIRSNQLQTHFAEHAINHGELICNTVQEIKNYENVFKDEMVELRNSFENRVNGLEGSTEEKLTNIDQLQTATQNQIEHLQTATQTLRIENERLKEQTERTKQKNEELTEKLKRTENKLKKTSEQTETQKQELDQLKILLGPVIEREQREQREQREKDNKRECVIEIEDDFIKKMESLKKNGDEVLIDEETVYLRLRKFKMKVYLRRNFNILFGDSYSVSVTLKLERGKYGDEVNLKEKFIIEVREINKDGEIWDEGVEFVVNERLKEESKKECVAVVTLNKLKNEMLVNNKLILELKVK